MRKHLEIRDGLAQDTLGEIAWLCEMALEGMDEHKAQGPHYMNGWLSGALKGVLRHIRSAEEVTKMLAARDYEAPEYGNDTACDNCGDEWSELNDNGHCDECAVSWAN